MSSVADRAMADASEPEQEFRVMRQAVGSLTHTRYAATRQAARGGESEPPYGRPALRHFMPSPGCSWPVRTPPRIRMLTLGARVEGSVPDPSTPPMDDGA